MGSLVQLKNFDPVIINKSRSASAQTISRWIKQMLAESGVDVGVFSEHSTRHASTSTARAAGVSLGKIRKTADEEIDDMPFMTSPIPLVTLVAVYFLFVLKIGPAFMKDRKPFNLKKTLIVYNTMQVAFSTFLFYRYIKYVSNAGIIYSKCLMDDPETRQVALWNIWFYTAAKVTELLDTIFFVLRKKTNQASFLHIYHHSIMLTGSWFFLKYGPSDLVTFSGVLNAFVHIVMYAYYALAAMGPHMAPYLTWKKHLTSLQLVQFVACFFVYLGNQFSNECPPNKYLATFMIFNNLVFLVLFSKFYYKNYIKNRKKSAKNDLNKQE